MQEKMISQSQRQIQRNKVHAAHKQQLKKIQRRRMSLVLFTLVVLTLTVYFVTRSMNRMQAANEPPEPQTNIPISSTLENQSLKNQSLVSQPIGNEPEDVFEALKRSAQENDDYAFIYENRDEYPFDLLNSLVHNEELLVFVRNYFDADKNSIGSLSKEELEQNHPLFIQWDERWGYADYGDSIMAVSGCGPTCLSMAAASLTKNEDATPYAVAQFSYENGYYVNGNGTSWTLISEGAEHYGLSARTLPLHKPSLTQALDNGNVLIFAMGPGQFTSIGHYIIVYDYDDTGFYVNDPNSLKRSENVWQFEEISDEIRNIWALSKA